MSRDDPGGAGRSDAQHPSLDTIAVLSRRLREIGESATALARLTRDLPGFLRAPLTPEQVRARLLDRLGTRERRFLSMVERAIYRHPGSPYLKLLRQAGCELGDVRALIAREGIEGALATLANDGVYVSFDEMRGRCDAVRGSRRFRFDEHDFVSPLVRPHLYRFTGGSRGRPMRVPISLAFVDEWATSVATALEAHGVHERPVAAFWWPLPVVHALLFARIGSPSAGWFYPVHPLPRGVAQAARVVDAVARLSGFRVPPPRRCDLDAPEPLVNWLAARLADGRPVALWTTASAGARLGIAARARGIDLCGLTMLIGSEVVTEARQHHIEAAGARAIAKYGTVELSGLSHACATPATADDVHVHRDRYAVVQRQRTVTEDGPTVDSLLFTGLTPTGGTIALNAEPGDYATVEERSCDCLLGKLGMRIHLTDIGSFEKLTGEGVTFARSNLQQLLEAVLPSRFGGTGLDYQLSEEEAPTSATRLVLRVSPAVGPLDEATLQSAFFEEISRSNTVVAYQAEMWRRASTLEVRPERPLATPAGKLLPFLLMRHARSVVGKR